MNERAQKAQDCLKAAKLLYRRFLVNTYEGTVSVRLSRYATAGQMRSPFLLSKT